MVADLARFKQILFNLLSNAVKFTPAGGRVTLRGQWVDRVGPQAQSVAAAEAKAARFEVEDTGVGIDPRDQQLIGSEFYQARRSRSQAAEGTGLGLALTQRLAALMGGAFWFRSTPGEGSCFSFALPLRAAGQAARAAPAPALAAAEQASESRGRPLALVIEDHIPTNKLLTDWLLEAGLEVESAFSGPEGVEHARRLRPRLILLDIRLPGMDGWQVLSELKGRPETASIPVVVVSVMDGQHLPREVDIADWVVKPVDKEQFLQGLRAACPTLFTPGRPLTALLVDDEPRTRKWLRDMLAAEGLTVIEAGSGAEALTLLPEVRPDLVLLDLLMPETDGFDFVEGVRADRCWQHLPILVVTAQDVTGEDWKRLHGRIQAVLAKDVLTREKLLDRLRRIGFTLPEPRPEGGAPA
jgi:CheY-like chemotaxis protein